MEAIAKPTVSLNPPGRERLIEVTADSASLIALFVLIRHMGLSMRLRLE